MGFLRSNHLPGEIVDLARKPTEPDRKSSSIDLDQMEFHRQLSTGDPFCAGCRVPAATRMKAQPSAAALQRGRDNRSGFDFQVQPRAECAMAIMLVTSTCARRCQRRAFLRQKTGGTGAYG
jgi:hypothetical protein